MKKILSVALAAASLVPLAGCADQAGSDSAEAAAPASDAVQPAPVAVAPPEPAFKWQYESNSDPMTDKLTRIACVSSAEPVQLGSPYGAVFAQLCLRDSPKFGRDAYVALQGEGQMLCASYEGCTLTVRFDKAPLQKFSGSAASDYSANIIFIDNRSRLEQGIAKAEVTHVEAEFYQAGRQVMSFPTAGFSWPKADAAE